MVTNLVITVLIGGFMGLLTHAKRNKTIIKPRSTKRTFNPGFLTDVAFGVVAAIAVVIVADPSGLERVILTAILGGYAGEGVIAKMYANNMSANQELLKGMRDNLDQELPQPSNVYNDDGRPNGEDREE